jgi:hypothetical protein
VSTKQVTRLTNLKSEACPPYKCCGATRSTDLDQYDTEIAAANLPKQDSRHRRASTRPAADWHQPSQQGADEQAGQCQLHGGATPIRLATDDNSGNAIDQACRNKYARYGGAYLSPMLTAAIGCV